MSVVNNQFNLNSVTAAAGSVVTRTAFNQFDEFGLLLGLPRLKGELNSSYKRRLSNTMVDLANSTYRGLINAITRELGLELFNPIAINPKKDSYGGFFAPDPLVKVDGVYIYLYSDYANDILDFRIDRFEPGGNYEHLFRLVDFINQSTYFEAHLLMPEHRFTRSMTIINQSNRVQILLEDLQASTKFKLNNQHLIHGSVSFLGTNIFRVEVENESDVEA